MTHNAAMDPAATRPAAENHHRIRAARERLRLIAYWLEGCIRIPGTKWRIGLEPIIGLVPVLGDVIGFLLSGIIILEGIKLGAPAGLIARMIGIVILDVLVGLVPVLGDLFDFAYKANKRNADLLTRHLDELEGRPRPQSLWRSVLGLMLLLCFAVLMCWGVYWLAGLI